MANRDCGISDTDTTWEVLSNEYMGVYFVRQPSPIGWRYLADHNGNCYRTFNEDKAQTLADKANALPKSAKLVSVFSL